MSGAPRSEVDIGAVVGFSADGGEVYMTPFCLEDEMEATQASDSTNWLRELDRCVFVSFRMRAFELAAPKKVKIQCMAAWIAVRGDLCSVEAADELGKLQSSLALSACQRLTVETPLGLATLVKFLMGKPTQRLDRIPLPGRDGISSLLAPLPAVMSSVFSSAELTRDKPVLKPAKQLFNTNMYTHRLSDMLRWFHDLPLTATLTPEVLDGFGALAFLSFHTAVLYVDITETFASSELQEDHDNFHVPVVALWNMLHKMARVHSSELLASVRALYAVLRPTAFQRDFRDPFTMQVNLLVMFSILGHLLQDRASLLTVSATVGPYQPAWLYGVLFTSPELEVFKRGVKSAWDFLNDSTSPFCRLVLEVQCQLHVMVLRRAKCCYSNSFVFTR